MLKSSKLATSNIENASKAVEDNSNLALLVIVTGVLMAAVDTTIVVLALPSIETSLKAPLSSVIWVIIAYILVITIFATQFGKLGDIFGRVRSYEAGFLIFIVGSALCAISFNEVSLIVFRVLQGIGGALLSANSSAVIADTFKPDKRGRAFGFNAAGWNVGAIAGILLGGLIINYVSWRWIFWINVPAGIFAFCLALKVLKEKGIRKAHFLDYPGMILLALGLFCVLWALTKLSTQSWSLWIIFFLIVGIICLVFMVVVESKVKEPMINLDLFKIKTVFPTLSASFFQALANFAILFLIIMYLQGVKEKSPLVASVLLIPGYVIGAVVGPLSGRIADRVPSAIPATIGLVIQIIALIIYSQLTILSPLYVVIMASVISGIGSGFFFPANTSAVMKVVPQSVFGIASGMLRMFANIGMVFSFAVSILVAARAIPKGLAFGIFIGTKSLNPHLATRFSQGLRAAFIASIGFMAVAIVLSSTRVLTRRPRNIKNQELFES